MLLVLAMAAGLWAIGWIMGAPKSARWAMIALLYMAVVGVQIGFPVEHPLVIATGGSLAMWLLLGGAVALVLAYSSMLQRLRRRADANQAVQGQEDNAQALFSDTELNRYARHIVLREVGGLGQKKLKDAKVLVVGAGGLGSPVLLYLAAAGVGRIGVVDDDVVDNSNLQRQVIHKDAAIGTPKVLSAAEAMVAQNPYVEVVPYPRRLTVEDAEEIIGEYDLVLDGTDNFDTRYLVNEICVAQGKPLISGALSQWEGQLSVFDPANGAPCYQCIFPQAPAPGMAPSCAEAGVIGPLPGVVGTMMAAEAIKVITGAGAALRGEMMIYDALWGETRKIGLKPRAACPVCGTGKS
ncbi:HesA/MoeB/ThiF family protein [Shimia marina]|uniref:Molybdopterin-synthase adenylyltransferase n=1 Tax=Shimia marina TaxID=321267 RepID=A0A0P1EUW2_9RHOB|nr:HesA/MoeB/ThiF family protein [Shimia marina]CUH54338.1 putative adenylyltransferase/sulfurtransferase MoeZ [Shimia marina]SFE00952.1 Molybdopterin or thiamine biosynthesis adenylyltransferase [Shimia marina]